MEHLTSVEKMRIALRYFLLGKGFTRALQVFDYAENIHVGFRKDGVTPSFHHQIWIATFITTLPLPDKEMELAICLAFLHDTPEDHGVSYDELNNLFGDDIAKGAIALAKKYRGTVLTSEEYFGGLLHYAMAVIVKGVDRLNNISTMTGVFKPTKQRSYVGETKEWHLPMLKEARRKYPQYNAAFENIKYAIKSRIEMIELYLETIGNQNEAG